MPAVLDRPTSIKPATKEEFITALRSGNYEQCTNGSMKNGNQVCAMMVFHTISNDPEFNTILGNESILGIPLKIYGRIVHLNDSGVSFSKLADILETHLSDDFKTLSY